MNTEQKNLVRARAQRAVQNLYHNATPLLWNVNTRGLGDDLAQSWFNEAAHDVIEWLNDGGGYGRDYVRTLNHPANRKANPKAHAYYVRWKTRTMRADQDKGGLYERITDWGKLYTYGRGGRTLAPCDLVRERGGSSFSMREDFFDDQSMDLVTDAIRAIEAFNAFCEQWCSAENLQQMFDEANVADVEEAAELSET
jgi:hypothetical protein